MPEERTCDYTGEPIEPGTGIMYVKANGEVLHFVNSKAEKNYFLGREPRDLEWTEAGGAPAATAAEEPTETEEAAEEGKERDSDVPDVAEESGESDEEPPNDADTGDEDDNHETGKDTEMSDESTEEAPGDDEETEGESAAEDGQ